MTPTDLSNTAADSGSSQMYIPETEKNNIKYSKTTAHWMISFIDSTSRQWLCDSYVMLPTDEQRAIVYFEALYGKSYRRTE
jgi:hypothetical protein